ncbi:MAG TPA: MFS transporter [Candidatus Megaira endosymbiont of Hartmannula sinica]|nr:MFS transporter [Candidatus Megaera endosymbiont of Hartmannula sinica]
MFKETKALDLKSASFAVALYEVTGVLGGFAAGYISDRLFDGSRGKVGAFFMICLTLFITLFWYFDSNSFLINSLLFTLMGFFVYGPQVLVGVASADFASSKAIGTANGFAGSMAYLGSAISGIVIGRLCDLYGWNSVIYFFIISSLFGALFFMLSALSVKKNTVTK